MTGIRSLKTRCWSHSQAGAFSDGGMLQARALDFDGADAMAGDLDDLVGAAAEPDVPVLVDVRGVAAVVDARNALPVVPAVALGFSPQTRGETRKRPLQDHDPFFTGRARSAVERDDRRVDARQRNRC